MKKGLLKLSAFVATLFVGVISANAAIDVVGSECRFNDLTTTNASCELKLQVSGDDTITTGKESNYNSSCYWMDSRWRTCYRYSC